MHRMMSQLRATCGVTLLLLAATPAVTAQPIAPRPDDPATPPRSVTRAPGDKAPADVEEDPELAGAVDDTGGEDDLSEAADDTVPAEGSGDAGGKPVEGGTPPEPSAPDETVATPADAFTGIRGKVVDANTGEGLIEAQIKVVKGGAQSTLTEVDGSFELALPPGEYELRIFTALYTGQRYQVTIEKGQAVTLEAKLSAEDAVEEVVVVAAPDITTAAVEVARRRKRATVSDAISAEQISRSPDSNASDAAKRVVGATVQDNRYVVIRGLGGRYSLTLLNGVPLPSPDPDVPAAPLDLFPAALVANLTVTKTFSADMPGNFAGGAMSIESRSYPSKFTLKAKLSAGFDSQSTLQSADEYRGGSTDFLGYDDGTRDLPSAIPTNRKADDRFSSASDEEILRQQRSFENNWDLEEGKAAPTGSVGLTVGDTLTAGQQRLGYLASVNYGNATSLRRTHIAGPSVADGQGGIQPSTMQLDQERATRRANLGGLLTAGWTPSPPHRINLVGLYTHSADDTASRTVGNDLNSSPSTPPLLRKQLGFVERELMFSQLFGEHDLVGGKAQLQWQGNLAHVAQDEPDTRELVQSVGPDGQDGPIGTGSGAAERLYSGLGDTTGGGGFDVTVPLSFVKLKAGGSFQRSSRDYQVRRFHFEILNSEVAMLPPDQAFAPEHAGSGVLFEERTLPGDGYQATRDIAAGFVQADLAKWDPLRIVAGARLEQSNLDVSVGSQVLTGGPSMPASSRHDRSILPTINVVYGITKDSALRAAYAITVARPNFREIAPALYFDYARRRSTGGNPDLVETSIHNADLRWETYLSSTELLAASVFYKHFIDPIEKTLEDVSSGYNVSFANSGSANTFGLELEARASLGRIASPLAPFTLSGNLSVIRSRIETKEGARPLQGQSPFVANISLGYDRERSGTQANLLYNVYGERIEEVGIHGTGNLYEQPFHRLDLTLSQRLSAQLKLKVAGTNLLNQRVVLGSGDQENFAYRIGVGVVASLELSVE